MSEVPLFLWISLFWLMGVPEGEHPSLFSAKLFSARALFSAHRFGGPGLFQRESLTVMHHTARISTCEESVNPSEADLQGYLAPKKVLPPRTLQ